MFGPCERKRPRAPLVIGIPTNNINTMAMAASGFITALLK
jgi:hypothetical protein